MAITLNRVLAFAALVVFIIVAVLAFLTTDAGTTHLLGGIAVGLACMAAAAVAP